MNPISGKMSLNPCNSTQHEIEEANARAVSFFAANNNYPSPLCNYVYSGTERVLSSSGIVPNMGYFLKFNNYQGVLSFNIFEPYRKWLIDNKWINEN